MCVYIYFTVCHSILIYIYTYIFFLVIHSFSKKVNYQDSHVDLSLIKCGILGEFLANQTHPKFTIDMKKMDSLSLYQCPRQCSVLFFVNTSLRGSILKAVS